MNIKCPICESEKTRTFFEDKSRSYINCGSCNLAFVEPKYFIQPVEEKDHYSMHKNSQEDQGYRSYLNQFFDPFKEYVNQGMSGLDYGCGPGPALSVMFKENKIQCSNYDPFFFNEEHLLEMKYDFISCTEVAEHFYEPIKEFTKMFHLLKPNGTLGIMTQIYAESIDFPSWYYIKDKTHVHFYSKESLRIIASKFNANVTFYNSCVAIFTT